ncbi:hypothetical protein GCM10022397_39810 [Flavivirga jejuensis]
MQINSNKAHKNNIKVVVEECICKTLDFNWRKETEIFNLFKHLKKGQLISGQFNTHLTLKKHL